MFLPSERLFQNVGWIYNSLAILTTIVFFMTLFLMMRYRSLTSRKYKIILYIQLIVNELDDLLVGFLKPFVLLPSPLVVYNPLVHVPARVIISIAMFYYFNLFTYIGTFYYCTIHKASLLQTGELLWAKIAKIFSFLGISMIYGLVCTVLLKFWNGGIIDSKEEICRLKEPLLCSTNFTEAYHLGFDSGQMTLIKLGLSLGFIYALSFIALIVYFFFYTNYLSMAMSESTREIQRFMSRLLYLQTFVVTICIVIPIFFLFLVLLGVIQGEIFESAIGIVWLWISSHSLFNSLAIIFASKVYRKAVKGWIFGWKGISKVNDGNPLYSLHESRMGDR